MCVEISNTMAFPAKNTTTATKKVSYSIKKLLKHLFKQSSKVEQQNIENTKKAESLESLESLENLRNADIESECSSLESFENEANERLSAAATVSMCDFEFADIHTVPVHFVRTEHGTFFWTATADIPADNDLVEPLYCATANQVAISQFHDRWAQA